MKSKEFYLVAGPQGSGKTTQGKMLAEILHFRFISTGELLRAASLENNPLGKKLQEYWATGDLVPDEIIEGILFPILESSEIPGFVIDGYPRTLVQIETFTSFLTMNDWKINDVFYFHLDDEECLRRILSRTQIEKRPDESLEAVSKRLELYHEHTEPLLKTYHEMGILKKIDGSKSIAEIHADVRKLLPSISS